MRSQLLAVVMLVGLAVGLAACGGGGGGSSQTTAPPPEPNEPNQPNEPNEPNTQEVFSTLEPTLDDFRADDYVFILGDASGRLYTYTKGDATETEVRLVASFSKWLTSAVIMSLVNDGVLALSDNPQSYIPWWTNDPADPRSQITIEQLLSFTSGFSVTEDDDTCVRDEDMTLESCAMELYQIGITAAPGTEFNYGPAHLQIVAYIAEQAAGQRFADLFTMLVAQPLGMTNTNVLTDTDNPYISGGFRSTVADTERFIRAIMTGNFLAAQRDTWDADRTGPPVTLGNAPPGLTVGDLEWRYALGHWRECETADFDADCADTTVVSSPGALGWDPWIDYDNGYYAVVAWQAEGADILTLPGVASIELGYDLRPLIEEGLNSLR
ncbi:serine hydrolase domain-containing protein [Mangrovimicrobium sediminis]|nr:serine hydrolase [Haliea sp. SAOS-164]